MKRKDKVARPYGWRFRWSSRLRHWWYKWSPKNRHSCLKCGFLSFDGKEPSADVRRTITAEGIDGWFIEEDAVNCFKERWYWDVEGDPATVAIHEANKPRFNCVGFHRHSPGRSPQDHLKLEDEARDFHRKFILALIGAIVTLVVAWLGLRLAEILVLLPVILRLLAAGNPVQCYATLDN